MTHISTMNGPSSMFEGGQDASESRESEGRSGPGSRGGFAWAGSLKRKLTGEAVSQKLLLVVTSQLAVMLASGCDLCARLEVLAKQQALDSGAYEAWFVDRDGHVTEGSSTNAWIVVDGQEIVTRPLGNDILAILVHFLFQGK